MVFIYYQLVIISQLALTLCIDVANRRQFVKIVKIIGVIYDILEALLKV
jgi:hypothetical protein